MNLDQVHKETIARWINEGMKLAEIQKRMDTELHITITYMELRLLVNELQVMPKDPPPAPTPILKTAPAQPVGGSTSGAPNAPTPAPGQSMPGPGKLSISVDALARPGAMVSGNVQFSDGMSATWQLDQMGRLGLAAKQPGYRPSPADLQEFQIALENELAKSGL